MSERQTPVVTAMQRSKPIGITAEPLPEPRDCHWIHAPDEMKVHRPITAKGAPFACADGEGARFLQRVLSIAKRIGKKDRKSVV